MKIAVSQSINCAHQLPGTAMHGHTYRVTAFLHGDVNQGMVMPIQEFRAVLVRVLRDFDHLQLESVIGEPATAERLAVGIKAAMPFPVQIRVEIGDEGWVETE